MDRLIEIRVHGVSGTPPADMLTGPVERVEGIPGDVWKRSDRDDGVRAVRWSNLTSGSPVSALWLTLIPYMLLNLAGWAFPPAGKWRHRAALVTIRVAGLALTMIFSTVTAVGFIGVGGYQVLRGSVGTGWSLVLGAVASLAVVLGLWLASSTVGDDAAADRVYLRSLHVAVAMWAVWWTLVVAAREAYVRAGDVSATGGIRSAWPIPVIAGAVIVVVGLIEGLERFARPIGIGLAVTSGILLLADSVAVLTAPGVGNPQPDRLREIDNPLTAMVQWYAALALTAMVLSVSRRHREAGPTIGTFMALAGSTGASVGAAIIWLSAKATGAEPPGGIAPIAEAFLTGTSMVLAVVAVVVLWAARPGEPVLRGIYESAVRARNGILPVLVAVPSVTGAVLVMTVAGLQLDGRAPAVFGDIATISGTVFGLSIAAALVRLHLRGPGAAVAAAVVVVWVAVTAGLVDVDFTTISVLLTLTIPLALVATRVVGALRDRDKRRSVAVAWDIGSYFARRFHPFAPPTYRDRAIADLEAAVEHFRAEGNRVLIGAHSQGTVVCAAAISEAENTMATGFLTYGSPLGSLYARFFPRYFTDDYLTGIGVKVPGGWINLWRPTDPISGPLAPGPDDREIEDTRVRGHAGYWRADEAEFSRAIDELEARIEH